MTTSLYWKIKVPAQKRLPLKLKEKYLNQSFPGLSMDYLMGFYQAMPDNDPEKKAVCELISAMDDGKEIEFEVL